MAYWCFESLEGFKQIYIYIYIFIYIYIYIYIYIGLYHDDWRNVMQYQGGEYFGVDERGQITSG